MSSTGGDNNENDKTLTSSSSLDDETMNQNNNNIIKQLNYSLDKIIDKSKSFEDQIKSIRKVENLMSIILSTITVIKS